MQDLHYGDVLFYFFQDDYFDSITRLLAARQLDRIPHTQGRRNCCWAVCICRWASTSRRAGSFEALLNKNTSEAVRNRAWFYLGKVWYQRGYLEESERALQQVSDKIDPRINAERYMLLAQLMMRQGRYDDAIAALSNWHGAPDWTAYAQFNLGVALVRRGRLAGGRSPYLDRVGTHPDPQRGIVVAEGQGQSRAGVRAAAGAARRRKPSRSCSACGSKGPYSSKALLGVGWADAGMGEFKRALVPWLALRKRSLLDSAVQESFLTVPYAYAQLSATGQAAEYYNSAIDSFDAEMQEHRRFDRRDPHRQAARPSA